MSNPTSTRPHALLILGMHRSGTSAVTRVVNLLGAEIGDRLIPSGHDNPSGFWENATAVEINEQLLRDLDRTWYDMREMPDGWMETAAAAKALDLARKFIRRDLGGSTFCVLKDPRTCLTAPLWIKAFESLEFEVSCLFVIRDPREVVESLHRRNQWPRSPLYLMWVQYLLEAEAATRGCRRTMMSYDQLLDDWRASMAQVSTDLHVTWPVDFDSAGSAIDTFLDRGQRHHHAAAGMIINNEGSTGMPGLVQSLYVLCMEIIEGKPRWDAVAGLHSDFRGATELYAERVDSVLTERWRAEARAQTAEAKAQEAEVELAERGSIEKLIQEVVSHSQQALEAKLGSLDEHVANLEKQAEGEREERAAQWGAQASLIADAREAMRLSHEALETRIVRAQQDLAGLVQESHRGVCEMLENRIGAVEQNFKNIVQEYRQDTDELDGRILRHQEALQAVEARLQRQYALLNTVLLRLEQGAGDRLAERVADLAGRVDAIHGTEMQTLRQDLEDNKLRLAGLLRSTSWRLTRPLRWISVHLLRKPPANE
jgi:hypothetical protein